MSGAVVVALLLVSTALLALPVLARVGIGSPPGPPAPASLPDCRIGDVPAEAADYSDWADTLLDTTYTLDRAYEPPDLAPVVPGRRDLRLRSFVVPDLQLLLAAARADGVSIEVVSGFRDYQGQAETFQFLADAHGEAYALLTAARPGHSEHQLGTTVDLKGGRQWLDDNAWRFGFLMSYPPGRSPTWTCYRPEPWHYRYFGRQRAAEINSSGLSPREWLWLRRSSEERPSSSQEIDELRPKAGLDRPADGSRDTAPTSRSAAGYPRGGVARTSALAHVLAHA
jgi:zinc D-Ala-D-Ala carboxypeptidase